MSSASLFRAALARFAAGVTVITAKNKTQPVGVTISSFTSLSLNPPLILFCLDTRSSLLKCFSRNAPFAVHVLHDKQKPLAELFAARGARNWHAIPHQLNADGVPVLPDVMAVLFCRVKSLHKGGDHRIIIGSVDDILLQEKNPRPLLYSQRSYYALGQQKK